MKKLLAILMTLALVCTLVSINAFADEGHYVWNHTGDYVEDPFNTTFRIGHDSPLTGTVKFKTDVSFSKVLFPKIWATPHAQVTFEILSGESVVYTGSFELFNEENGSGDVPNVEVDLGKTLSAGVYTFRFTVPEGQYAFFAYGNGQLPEGFIVNERGHMMIGLWTTDNGQGFVDLGVKPQEVTVSLYDGTASADPQDALSGPIAIVLTVPADYMLHQVIGFNSPTWGNASGEGSDAIAEVYKWTGDYDDSVAGDVLASGEVIGHPDNQNAVFTLSKDLPAGDYLVEFTATGEKSFGFWAFGAVEGDHEVFKNGAEASFYPQVGMFLVLNENAQPATTDEPPVVESFIKALSRDQLMIDGADRAKFGGNDAVTDVDLKADVGKELKIWGWVGTTSPIKGFGYRVNGQEVSDPSFVFEAEPGVINAAAEKGATEASRYAIMFPVTEGVYTVEAFVTTDAGTETIWTINVVAGDAPQPVTGDASVAMIAVLVVLTMGAAVVFARKKSY